MFNNLTTEGLESSGDSLGGFTLLDTGAYNATVKAAYGLVSPGGAKGVALVFTLEDGKEYRETVYITSREGNNYYLDRDGKTKKLLPGFQTINDLCLLAAGKELKDVALEERVVKVYDRESNGEINKAVPMLMDLIGQPITIGILKSVTNKTVKNDATGTYDNEFDAEGKPVTREENSIDKFFHAETKGTVTEYLKEVEPGQFYAAWTAKNHAGEVRNRVKTDRPAGAMGAGRPPMAAGRPPMAAAPAAGAAPRPSPFGKK